MTSESRSAVTTAGVGAPDAAAQDASAHVAVGRDAPVRDAGGPPPGRRSSVSDVRIGGRPIEFAPHNCFACGSLNTNGLQLALHADADGCWTELALDRRFEGWEGIAHGGIVCTLLDEVMAWALINHDTWGVTARMSVEFRRPVPVGTTIRAAGRVLQARRRVFRTEGVVVDAASGLELARAEGTYVAAPEERKRELKERYGFRYLPGETRDIVATGREVGVDGDAAGAAEDHP